MNDIYNKIDSKFKTIPEKNTALNIADNLFYGYSFNYNIVNCGVTLKQYKKIFDYVFELMAND